MTQPGAHPGELGNVYVAVVPSMAGMAERMRLGGAEAAREFSTSFRQHTAGQLFNPADAQAFAAVLGNAGRTGGEAFERGIVPHLSTVSRGLHAGSLAAGAMGGAIVGMGQLATGALEGVAEAGEEVVKKFIEVGETWENVRRQIIVKVPDGIKDGPAGASAAYTDLMNTIKAVASESSASIGQISDATTSLARRLKGALNDSDLRDVILDVVDAEKMLGEKIDTSAFVASMHALGVPLQQADQWFNRLFNISRATGVPLTALIKVLQDNGAALKEFNIPADAAAALMAEMGEHGISTQKTLKGLQGAAKEAAKESKTLPDFLRDTIQQMERFRDQGNKIAEEKVAERAFGPRAALDFMNAIDQGVLSVDALSEALDAPNDKASTLYRATETLSDRFGELKNMADVSLGDIATTLNEQLGDALKHVGEWVKSHGGEIIGWLQEFGDIGLYVSGQLVEGFGEVASLFGGIARTLGAMTDDAALQKFGAELMDAATHADELGRNIIGTVPRFDQLMTAARQSQEVLDLLNQGLAKTSDGKGLKIKDNSGEVMERLKKLGVEITQTPDGKLHITADTPENAKRVKDWIKAQTGQDLDVKIVPKPQTADGKPYGGDPASLFPGIKDGIHVPVTLDPPGGGSDPHDTRKWWQKPPWGNKRGTNPLWPGWNTPDHRAPWDQPLPTGPNQTPEAGADTDRDAKRGATRDYAQAHGNDTMPPGTAQWLDGKGPIPPALEPFYHPQHHKLGGPVPGFGSGDTQPAMLEPGEWIAPKWMAQKYGGALENIRVRGYKTGGLVGGGILGGDDGGYPYGANVVSPQQKADEEFAEKQREAARAVERQKDHIEDLTNTIDDENAKITDLKTQLQDETLTDDERTKLNKEMIREQQSLSRSQRDLREANEDLTTTQRKQGEAGDVSAKKDGGGSNEEIGSAMGKGLVQGIFQELGFPDVFGKSPTQWGITRLLSGGLGFGLEQLLRGHGATAHGGAAGVPGLIPRGLTPTGPQPVSPFGVQGWQGYPGSPGPGNQPGDLPAGPGGQPLTRAATAAYIVQQAQQRGFTPEQTTAILSTGLQESGLDESARGGGGAVHGVFQQDSSYPNRDDTAANVNAFFDRLGAPGGDIWQQIFGLQQGTPYNSPGARKAYLGEIQSHLAEAQQLFNQVAGGGPQPAGPRVTPAAFNNVPGPGGGFGAAAGHPTIPPPDENQLRGWVEQNFGIKNTFGTGNWENSAHEDDHGWHHPLPSMSDFKGPLLPSGGGKFGYGFDFHGSTEQMDSLANWIADNDRQNTLELIHQGPGFNTNREIKDTRFGDVYGPALDAEHRDHVHWALAAPPYGQGGVVPDAQQMTPSGQPVYPTPPQALPAGWPQQSQPQQPPPQQNDLLDLIARSLNGGANNDYEAAADAPSPFGYSGDRLATGGLGPAFSNFIGGLPQLLIQKQDEANPNSPSKLASHMQASRPQDARGATGSNTTNYHVNNNGVMGKPEINDTVGQVLTSQYRWNGMQQPQMASVPGLMT